MERGGTVYIMTNKRYGVLYIGVTSDIAARATQHREGKGGGFTARFNCKRLVYVEQYPTIEEAIAREKAMKAWRRMWKIEAIEKQNPAWDDLYLKLLA
ncbi:MAG: GIY-YIG nuclease family protein [Hydrogenophaga sp.]|jgi:putative endonuclease|uniref:GIY-YIG nuclease family protein n=1 Tax=Porphyrobacter sp. MBR-155 TaxID=3156464 RepID=UPI002746762D|nr:GIY-YIG nuclease family protein [Erythrobacter sp.]MDZ4124117.1 GIY-YIG nuclease family protein [Hydrogenophaga sp.]MDZ4274285.1 GIY-YIG nuclease family protein [Erythrobacter sp.]MDZ4275477.1 GIY-YIG nuclease family protein [Erythrobacter sp.]